MPVGKLNQVVRQLRKLVGGESVAEESDTDLLRRFAGDRDEAAFAALVERHGPLVLGVCRRVLNDSRRAEEAFQATFVVLARQAGSLGRREVLASWLYRIAYQIAAASRTRGPQKAAV